MMRCAQCRGIIPLRGFEMEGQTYCGEACLGRARFEWFAARVPELVVSRHVGYLRSRPCPSCGGPGPLDLHRAWRARSFIILSSWWEEVLLACAACGRREQRRAIRYTALFGWWGVIGLVVSLQQIARNVRELRRPPDSLHPSPALERMVRNRVAAHVLMRLTG